RLLMKKIRIMYLPKLAMSLWFVSLFIFLTLTVSAWQGILEVKQLSIFPILLLILLSEQIFTIQVGTTPKQAAQVTMITFFLALLGYFVLSWEALRTFILLYPEAVIALVPINFIIGRWFGLRFTEYFRFAEVLKHGR
ncbi:MAG TPA: 7TM domain-containing protein, partial [Patescibacteria group bacterium]|nr:7TM domain-containing protein [Patescibacteria group bacterium]